MEERLSMEERFFMKERFFIEERFFLEGKASMFHGPARKDTVQKI